jgi:hypothetical protein
VELVERQKSKADLGPSWTALTTLPSPSLTNPTSRIQPTQYHTSNQPNITSPTNPTLGAAQKKSAGRVGEQGYEGLADRSIEELRRLGGQEH